MPRALSPQWTPSRAWWSRPARRCCAWPTTARATWCSPCRKTRSRWSSSDEQTLPATIREISAAADPVTRTFLVKADVGNAAVKLGQTATVLLELPQTAGVTKLPLSALKEEQGKTVVWVVDRTSMTVKPQPVQVAGADGNDAVIAGGLQPGQVVVTAGVHVLNPGQPVKFYVDPGAPSVSAAAASATAVTVK